MRWQMSLYKEMSGKAEDAEDPEKVVKRVQEVSAVLYHIELVRRRTHAHTHMHSTQYSYLALPAPIRHRDRGLFPPRQTEHPYKSKKMVWHKLLSKQRRRAVVACFRMTPLYNIAR